MIEYSIDLKNDERLKKWLKDGVPKAVSRSLILSAKETRKSVALFTARKVRDGKYYKGSKIKDLKKHIYFEPKTFPRVIAGNEFSFRIRHSRRRLNLYKIPFRMKRVSFKRTTKMGKTKTIRMNQILTSIYGRPFQVDPLKPFFLVGGSNRGKYFYKGKPKMSEKPIAMHRKGAARKPLKTALAPSLSETIENVPGFFEEIRSFGEDKWQDRVDRNINFFLGRIT